MVSAAPWRTLDTEPSYMLSCTSACQDPLFMGFFRQEYWSGLPFPAPGDLPDLGIEPRSPAFLIRQILDQLTYKGSPLYIYYTFINNLAKYISQSYSPNLDLLSSGLIDKLITWHFHMSAPPTVSFSVNGKSALKAVHNWHSFMSLNSSSLAPTFVHFFTVTCPFLLFFSIPGKLLPQDPSACSSLFGIFFP